MKKVSVRLNFTLILNVEEGVDVEEVINKMDYDFTPIISGVEVYGSSFEISEITNHH